MRGAEEAGASVRDLNRAIEARVAELRRKAAERRAASGDTRDTLPTPYFTRGGVIFRRCQTRDGEVELPLCNFDARITAVTVRDDGAEQRRFFTVRGRTASGSPLSEADVPADEFSGMGWTAGAWGNRAIVNAGQGTRDHIRAALQTLSGDVPERVVYSHLGWREVGGRWAYLHAGGAIGAEGVVVEPTGPLVGYILPGPPTGGLLTDAVRASLRPLAGAEPLAPDRVVVPVFGAAYRAVLGGVIDFAVHLTGPTGVFKSEVAALAQQHYGPGLDARNFPANWSATANAIEMVAFGAKDALVVVDDFAPNAVPDPAKLYATADRVFRGAGNRAGRGRLNPDLSVRPDRPPRGLILSTGEDLPRGHSIRARTLVTEVVREDVDADVLTECQRDAAAGLYASALSGFVAWLAPRYRGVNRQLPGERAAARGDFSAGAAHTRTPGAVADLWLGWRYFLDFAVHIGAVTTVERDHLLARVRTALSELADAQTEHQRAADPVNQFLQLVPAALASGAAYLEAPTGGHPATAAELLGWRPVQTGEGTQWQPRGTRIGWVDDTTVYLEPEAVFAEVQKLASAQRHPISMNARTLWARLHERKVLMPGDTRGGKDRHTGRITFGGERIEVLKFARRHFYPPQDASEKMSERGGYTSPRESVPSVPQHQNPADENDFRRDTPRDTHPEADGECPGAGHGCGDTHHRTLDSVPRSVPPETTLRNGTADGVGHSGHSFEGMTPRPAESTPPTVRPKPTKSKRRFGNDPDKGGVM